MVMSLAPKDLEEKRIRAAAEKEQKIRDAKEALATKRNQHVIELELKRPCLSAGSVPRM